MADTAAHLVDRVFPRVPVRQWVLSFPYHLRYRLAYDADLLTNVLGIVTKTIFTSLIQRACEFGAVRNAQCGAVSFIQRFDSALRLNLHIHSLVTDGVYAADDDGHPQFQVLPAPDDEEIARLTELLAKRIREFFCRRGLGPDSDPEESDPLARDQPWLAGLYAASVRGRTTAGNNSSRRATHRGDQIDPESLESFSSPRCATVDGFSLHANVAVPAGDRTRLERLVQYCARGPIAMERLELLAGGRLLYRFKRAWRDGSTHIVLTPLEMLEKLSALIPSPHAHLVRYAGIFAPAAKWRSLIVPTSSPPVETEPAIHALGAQAAGIEASNVETPVCRHGRNYTWAELMKRVWALDVLECPALPRTDANPHSDSFTGCDRKDSWLRRSAFPISSTLTCGARIQRCYRTILKPAVKMVQATSARFGPLLVKTLRPPGTRNSRLESSARPRLVYIRGHTATPFLPVQHR